MDSKQLNRKIIYSLFLLIKTFRVYKSENQALEKVIQEFQSYIEKRLNEDPKIRIEVVDRDLYVNFDKAKSDLYTFTSFQFLVSFFTSKNIGGITLSENPIKEEILSLLEILTLSSEAFKDSAQANSLLIQKNVSSLEFIPFSNKKSSYQKDKPDPVSPQKKALGNYIQTIDVMKSGGIQIHSSGLRKSTVRNAKRLVYELVDLCSEEGFSFFGLANIKNYDEYTFNHSVNVCVISIAFGRNLGLTKTQIAELGLAALFHDLGKIEVPKEILNKPGGFNEEEWQIMKTHPLQSVKRFLEMNETFQVQDIKKMIAAFEHHRNFDCTGYPNTGLNKPMNFYSKIVAIADAYDAMTTNRVYQRAMLATKALQILVKNAGTKFDPVLVKAFINTIGIFPVGSLVELNSGELAVVTETKTNPDQICYPKIKIILNNEKKALQAPIEIDLFEKKDLEIVKAVHPEDYDLNIPYYLFGKVLEEVQASS